MEMSWEDKRTGQSTILSYRFLPHLIRSRIGQSTGGGPFSSVFLLMASETAAPDEIGRRRDG